MGGRDVYFGYLRAQMSSQHYLLDLSMLPAQALLLFSRSTVLQADKRTVLVDGWLRIKCPELHSAMYHRLRRELERVFAEAMWASVGSVVPMQAGGGMRRVLEGGELCFP